MQILKYIPPYGYNMHIHVFSIYRPMISIYTSNISIFRSSETIAIVKNTIVDTITIATLLSQ